MEDDFRELRRAECKVYRGSGAVGNATFVPHTKVAQFVWASLLAGLTAASTEMMFVLPIQAELGASPLIVFQSIARGALGNAAFRGGLSSAAVGVFFHILISVVAAALFVSASIRWPVLIKRPVLSGIAFGAPVYVVMTFVVIPLSAIGFHPPGSAALAAVSFAIHLFAFGLPIALVTSAILKRRATT